MFLNNASKLVLLLLYGACGNYVIITGNMINVANYEILVNFYGIIKGRVISKIDNTIKKG